MRKGLVFILVAGLAILSLAGLSYAGIAQSKHDFSPTGPTFDSAGYARKETQICRVCHVPHGKKYGGRFSQALLWVQTNPTNLVGWWISNFWYTEWGTQGSISATTLTAVAGRCMSCHDGTDFNLGPLGNTYSLTAGNYANLGVDLQLTHPIGMLYIPAGGGGVDIKATPTSGIKLITVGSSQLVGCRSCHDPHNSTLYAGGGANDQFCVLTTAGSTLCLGCHSK